jgi:septal ring factor EnvC (AmiA/AmiB activator)
MADPTFWEFISRPGIAAALGVMLTSGFAFIYQMWLRKDQYEIHSHRMTLEALNSQLRGWVDYANRLNETIRQQQAQMSTMERRISEKDDRIADLERGRGECEQRLIDLLRRIRELEDRPNNYRGADDGE